MATCRWATRRRWRLEGRRPVANGDTDLSPSATAQRTHGHHLRRLSALTATICDGSAHSRHHLRRLSALTTTICDGSPEVAGADHSNVRAVLGSATWPTEPMTMPTTPATTRCWSGSTATCCPANARWCRCSTPGSCSATASGRGCGSAVATRRSSDRHLDRLEEGARAILLDLGMTREELTDAIYATLRANEMTDGVHVRLMVTRGVKSTPYQDPRVTIGPATVVIIAEHKEPMPATVTDGHHAVHHARTPGDAGHARPQAQRAQQAQRHPGVHPGLHGRRRRGADARPARLRGHLQQHPLLHRHARRRGLDLRRPVLPRPASPAATCSRCAGRNGIPSRGRRRSA